MRQYQLTAEQARDLYRWERAKRPFPSEPVCPYEKADAQYRWRLQRQMQGATGWTTIRESADERHRRALRIAFTGWVE